MSADSRGASFSTRPLALAAVAALLAGCGGRTLAPPLPGSPSGASVAHRLDAGPAGWAPSVVVTWNDAALQAIRTTHPGPPIVARMLAIANTCIYDAFAAYDAHALGTQFGDALRRPAAERTLENRRKAVSYGAYRALVDLFPTQVSAFTSVMTSLGYDPGDLSMDTSTPSGIGNVACAKVLAFRHHDGSNQLGDLGGSGPYTDYTGYAAVNTPSTISDPNTWQPLLIPATNVTQKYIAPFWGKVTPFAITSSAQYLPSVGPATYTPGAPLATNQHYIDQANEILAYSAGLTDTQKVIAEYWADGPNSELPPGHWILFSEFVSQRDHHSIKRDAEMFFAVSNTIFDASIAAWGTKRIYASVRPITAIRYLYSGTPVTAWAGPGKGTQTFDGGKWNPYQAATVVTPPFPEYVSGHSAFSAAGASILRYYTGSDDFGDAYTNFAGVSRVEPGITPATDVTLSWPTFSAAADEAGISRRYGGIHFIDGDLQGRAMGRKIGDIGWAKSLQYFNEGGLATDN